jgi:hypothetical protein
MAAAEAEQRHGDVLARPVDPVVHRPGDQASPGHRVGGLGEGALRIEAGDKCLGAEDVGEEAGGDLRRVARASRAECEADTGDGGGEEDDLAAAGHGLSPASGNVPGGSRSGRRSARRIWKMDWLKLNRAGRFWNFGVIRKA